MTYDVPRVSLISSPTDRDILFGRDDLSVKHIGNICLRTVVGFCLKEYQGLPQSKRLAKTHFFRDIVDNIQKSGGRFLQREMNGKWKEVGVQEAREKVAHELRDVARKPHILQAFSLVSSKRIEARFNSAHDFEWGGIVENAKRELTGLMSESTPNTASCKSDEMKNLDHAGDLELVDDGLESDDSVLTLSISLHSLSRCSDTFSLSDFSIHDGGGALP